MHLRTVSGAALHKTLHASSDLIEIKEEGALVTIDSEREKGESSSSDTREEGGGADRRKDGLGLKHLADLCK